MKDDKIYPEGRWMGIGIGTGIGIGMPIGLILGVLMDNIPVGIALGPAIGVGLGCGIGAGLEQKYKDQIRPKTPEEKRTAKIATYIGVSIAVIGLLLLIYLFLNH
jgi:hypothetical protein